MALVLLFNLSDETYGLEIEAVQEVVENPQRHYVPHAAGCLNSAINFHGQILPVINLPQLLAFPDESLDHRLMVLTREFHSLALEVSRVQRIVKLDLTLQQPPPVGAVHNAVRGVIPHEEQLINLLDGDEVVRQLEQIYQ